MGCCTFFQSRTSPSELSLLVAYSRQIHEVHVAQETNQSN